MGRSTMDATTLQFQMGHGRWDRATDSFAFSALAGSEKIDFVVTNEALAHLLDPDRGHISPELAVETFFEFEADIHRIAQLEFRKRAGESPIQLRREHMGD